MAGDLTEQCSLIWDKYGSPRLSAGGWYNRYFSTTFRRMTDREAAALEHHLEAQNLDHPQDGNE